MGTEQVSFLAGKDPYGDNLWVPASVEDREQRNDGEWLYVLPAFSDSEDQARWVKASDVRIPKSSQADAAAATDANTPATRHLRLVR